jgi:hypothetical protein
LEASLGYVLSQCTGKMEILRFINLGHSLPHKVFKLLTSLKFPDLKFGMNHEEKLWNFIRPELVNCGPA